MAAGLGGGRKPGGRSMSVATCRAGQGMEWSGDPQDGNATCVRGLNREPCPAVPSKVGTLAHNPGRWPAWQTRAMWLAPAGRLALTNYLSQTVFGLAVFYGIGLGLMGHVGAVWWPLIVACVIAIQVAFSRWWLERFAFGPLEWLWRQATYGRRLPMRR